MRAHYSSSRKHSRIRGLESLRHRMKFRRNPKLVSRDYYGMKTLAPRRFGVPKGRKIIAQGFIPGSKIHSPPGVPKGRHIASA